MLDVDTICWPDLFLDMLGFEKKRQHFCSCSFPDPFLDMLDMLAMSKPNISQHRKTCLLELSLSLSETGHRAIHWWNVLDHDNIKGRRKGQPVDIAQSKYRYTLWLCQNSYRKLP